MDISVPYKGMDDYNYKSNRFRSPINIEVFPIPDAMLLKNYKARIAVQKPQPRDLISKINANVGGFLWMNAKSRFRKYKTAKLIIKRGFIEI